MTIPAPGCGSIEIPPHIQAEVAERMRAETAVVAEHIGTTIASMETQTMTRDCQQCGHGFTAEGIPLPVTDRQTKMVFSAICEACEAANKATKIVTTPVPDEATRRRAKWGQIVGARYATFDRTRLPGCIQRNVDEVMAWRPQEQGIGLVGAPRTGKSPLIFGLGRDLYAEGVDVFPTSGIKFQQKYHRAFSDTRGDREQWQDYLARCESAEVLLIDDADKLNFTAGVEAEYYGMLEARRNALLPILCTCNLTGEEISELAKERADRGSAIVERLRDLCKFIKVKERA